MGKSASRYDRATGRSLTPVVPVLGSFSFLSGRGVGCCILNGRAVRRAVRRAPRNVCSERWVADESMHITRSQPPVVRPGGMEIRGNTELIQSVDRPGLKVVQIIVSAASLQMTLSDGEENRRATNRPDTSGMGCDDVTASVLARPKKTPSSRPPPLGVKGEDGRSRENPDHSAGRAQS